MNIFYVFDLNKVPDCKFKDICTDSTEKFFFSKLRAAVELSLAKTKFFH